MTYAEAASRSGFVLAAVACAGLTCLLLVSAAVLAIVLYRRSRRKGPDNVA